MSTRTLLACSFCGLDETKVAKLVAGPGVYICGGCVELARKVIKEAETQETAHDE